MGWAQFALGTAQAARPPIRFGSNSVPEPDLPEPSLIVESQGLARSLDEFKLQVVPAPAECNEWQLQEAINSNPSLSTLLAKESRSGKADLDRIYHLKPSTIQSLNYFLEQPDLPELQRVAIHSLFDKHLARITRQLKYGKGDLIQEDHDGLWKFKPECMTKRQRYQFGMMLAHYFDRYWNILRNGFKKPDGPTISRLQQLTQPFGKEYLVEGLQNYVPYHTVRGVQFITLPERIGPPVTEFTIGTYNMEHYAIQQFSEKRASFAGKGDKPPNEKQQTFLDELREKIIEGVIQSLRKTRRLAEVIRSQSTSNGLPDVLALQEVKSFEHLRAFTRLTGLNQHYPNLMFFPSDTGDDGLALLTTAQIRPTRPNRITTPDAPRPSGEAALDLGNGIELLLFNVHFKADKYKYGRISQDHHGLRQREAKSLGRRIRDYMNQNETPRVLVVGDVNTDTRKALNQMTQSLGLRDKTDESIPTSHRNGHLDRIFASSRLSVGEMEVVGDFGSIPPPPSDHLLVKARVKIRL
jgi:endonuclease/exonuclease/phosphatase family metal-dependent hydrolase